MPDNISPERRAMMERERAQLGSRAGFYDTKNLTDDYIRLLPIAETEPIGTKYVSYILNKKSYTCTAETFGQSGVISKTISALTKLGTPDALAMLNALKEARRYKFLLKIISRKAPTVAKWFEAPSAIYKVILNAFEKDSQVLYHSQTGRDIRISKEGSGKTSKYSAAVQDQSLLAATKEERMALKAAAAEMDPKGVIAPNEAGALEALKTLIPTGLWEQIAFDVTGQKSTAPAGGVAAARRAAVEEDEDAPATRSGGASVDEDEDAPAPKAAAPKATKPAPAPVVEEDEDAPAPKAAPKATKPAPAAVVEDDDEAPRPAANRAAAPKAVVNDEEEAPAPKAAKKHQIVDDDE